MNKIDKNYMVDSFNKVSNAYVNATSEVGLWNSEKDLILKYTNSKDDIILDMGCGAGRCALGIEKLGFKNIEAIDFSPEMIKSAKNITEDTVVTFEIGDCTNIAKPDDYYDFAIFSFNGLMQIPKNENRLKALKELKRVLKNNAVLIFTSHDRDNGNEKYKQLWIDEKIEWDNNLNDPRLHDYGDVITFDDVDDVEYFIHIPSYEEVLSLINESGLKLVDSFIRDKQYKEKKEVYNFSDNCRFWIVKK